MKLMIVDDNSAMRQMIRNVVAVSTDVVSECGDGSEAVDVFIRSQPDVVLMDLHMPKMNGITATRNIRRQFPDAQVIIVSNFNDEEFRQEAKDAGAYSYFTKDDLLLLKKFIRQ